MVLIKNELNNIKLILQDRQQPFFCMHALVVLIEKELNNIKLILQDRQQLLFSIHVLVVLIKLIPQDPQQPSLSMRVFFFPYFYCPDDYKYKIIFLIDFCLSLPYDQLSSTLNFIR